MGFEKASWVRGFSRLHAVAIVLVFKGRKALRFVAPFPPATRVSRNMNNLRLSAAEDPKAPKPDTQPKP